MSMKVATQHIHIILRSQFDNIQKNDYWVGKIVCYATVEFVEFLGCGHSKIILKLCPSMRWSWAQSHLFHAHPHSMQRRTNVLRINCLIFVVVISTNFVIGIAKSSMAHKIDSFFPEEKSLLCCKFPEVQFTRNAFNAQITLSKINTQRAENCDVD